MESNIGWLSPVAPPENVIIDTCGNEIVLSPEQLAIIKANEQSEDESLRDLKDWGGFNSTEEAEAFLIVESQEKED